MSHFQKPQFVNYIILMAYHRNWSYNESTYGKTLAPRWWFYTELFDRQQNKRDFMERTSGSSIPCHQILNSRYCITVKCMFQTCLFSFLTVSMPKLTIENYSPCSFLLPPQFPTVIEHWKPYMTHTIQNVGQSVIMYDSYRRYTYRTIRLVQASSVPNKLKHFIK